MASIFDIFSTQPAQDAAAAQIAGINSGVASATPALTTNYGNAATSLSNNYTSALTPFLTNFNTAQGGVSQLGNLLGLNGASGSQAALTALQNTPGYQFRKQQGDDAINAQAAATGQLASGNTALALSNYNQGLAGTTYQNAVQNLMPFLTQSNTAASGIGNIYTGLGSGLAGISTGLGNSLAGLNYNAATGIGNANANADLSAYNASGNFWNMLGGIGGMKTSNGGTIGGNALSGLGSLAMGIFSDERLKENIEPVGELYDGTSVYRYNYIGDDVPRIGVMAQEVEKTRPDAVIEVGGFKAVDYGKATNLAAALAKFVDAGDNVVKLDDYRAPQKAGSGYGADLSRFLEAA